MAKFGFSVKKVVSEHDNNQFYALINLDDDSTTKNLKCYSDSETEFFFLILQKFLIDPANNFSISYTDALNITHQMSHSFSKMEANYFIDVLIEERWLENVILMVAEPIHLLRMLVF